MLASKLQAFWREKLSGRFMPDTRTRVEKVSSFPALCFRHDMDGCRTAELNQFYEIEAGNKIPSTCFFLRWQIKESPQVIKKISGLGIEIGLHSEARPVWSLSIVQLLWLEEKRYRHKLKKQAGWMRRQGFSPIGHSAHSIHNYLGFQNWINWNTIEAASIDSSLEYISDWRTIAATPEGAFCFPEPLPPFQRYLKSKKILVLPTAWDDKYLFSSYEDRYITGSSRTIYKDRSLPETEKNLLDQFDKCRARNIPFIVNFHPLHGLKGELPVLDLKESLVRRAEAVEVPVMTLGELCRKITANTEVRSSGA